MVPCVCQPQAERMTEATAAHRYLATHGYNISLTHLVDQIASPYPKKLFQARTTSVLDAWPTPQDYYYNIREGIEALLQHMSAAY